MISNYMSSSFSKLLRARRDVFYRRLSTSSPPPFDKLLVANRGEIAIRVMRTCERLGIKTVAVYSEADSNSLFVRRANEAVCIGPAPSIQSYLNIDAIVDACIQTKAQAVHPGYGFLSEKASFAESLEKNNVVFVGPSRHSLHLMGDKIESKRCAQEAGVSIVPGYDGLVENADRAVELANQIGYPVMIKAAGGGGGKGMRISYNDNETRDGYRLSLAEAKSSFNDDRILIEKFIEEPKHVEFQILGDKFGNVVHLNERECSIQRRNQKLLEEAPSTALNAETRKIIGDQAVSLAKHSKYHSAGTVEFLIDKYGKFYFLEMNTRLQVEHPITEIITGVDIVEQMIRIAAGEKLPFTQNDIGINGWAIENRVNSENPYRNLGMPSIGRIVKYYEPTDMENVRIDSGIVEGSEISMYYDSLIAKLICYGPNREEALKLSRKALDRFVIRGVNHNISLLRDIMDDEDFSSGKFTTKYLTIKYPDGFSGRKTSPKELNNVISSIFYFYLKNMIKVSFPDATLDVPSSKLNKLGNSLLRKNSVFFLKTGDHVFKLDLSDAVLSERSFKVRIDDSDHLVEFKINSDNDYLTEACIDNDDVVFQKISRDGFNYKVQLYGTVFDATIMTAEEHGYNSLVPRVEIDHSVNLVTSPMQGSVISIVKKEGDDVLEGDEIAVVEAMKMQNAVLAHRNGKIKSVQVKVGDRVSEGDIIIEYH